MFRFIRNTFFLVGIVLLVIGAYLFFQGNSFGSKSTEAQVSVAPAKEIPLLHAILVQVDEESGNRRVLECSASGCTPKNPPKFVGINPLSDGVNWYRYSERIEQDKSKATVLEKVDAAGNVQTITEENPLVKPRAMMLSSDGTKIAYFLDNIHDKQDLTELWVYDSKEGGAKVVAEKLHRTDIASKVRWNASSNVVWFLQEGKKKELIVASLAGGASSARFTGIDWNGHGAAADTGVMDMNDDASLLAFVENSTPGFSTLKVVRGNEASIQKSIKGTVVFVRWMENDGLLYAVQDGKSLSFWMANRTKEWPITRMQAVFESAHSAANGKLAAFVASPRESERHLYVLQIETGLIKDETVIPNFSGKTYVVQASEQEAGEVAGATSSIADGVMVAFVEDHLRAMSQDPGAKASRMLITDIPNTLFIDYVDSKGDQRILATILDVTNPEWKIVDRYKTMNGLWKRSDATSGSDPKVIRLYEWEDALSKWILKQSY